MAENVLGELLSLMCGGWRLDPTGTLGQVGKNILVHMPGWGERWFRSYF